MKNVLIIVGSHRLASNSAKIANWIQGHIKETQKETTINVYDLAKTALPIWDESIWEGDAEWKKRLAPLHDVASQADALICVVPEYSGMAAPAFKNLMLMLSDKHVGHKPALLVTVSSGYGGSYPVAELRLSSYKNTRILWIPDHVIVRFAGSFEPPFDAAEQNQQAAERLEYGIKLLAEYAPAMETVRNSGVLDKKPQPFGM